MSQERNEWEFDVPSKELVEKCNEKVEHHKTRLAHYQGEQDTLRKKYIDSVQESAKSATEKEAREAEEWSNAIAEEYVAGGAQMLRASSSTIAPPRRKEIMGDPEIYQELQTALAKVQEHKGKVEAYARWGKLLQRDHEDNFRQLTYNDAVFFGL